MSDPVFSKDATGAGWFFVDEIGDEYGPYRTEKSARRHLAKYVYWLNNGPTRWQRVWWPVKWWFRWKLWPKLKEFWHDTRGAR